MKILIIAGGTGSIALQQGIYENLEAHVDELDVKILVNAYDNGLSTGAVRKVFGGKILGPSDVRKNQTTRHSLQYGSDSPILAFLNIRFTKPAREARIFCHEKITALGASPQHTHTLNSAVAAFFEAPTSSLIDYNDFSLANIIYAGLAHQNGNSLRAAASIMAPILGIKDNVLLNDDKSLFLGAISSKGVRVTDEGDIVSWGKDDDPFEDVFFLDENGSHMIPVLNQESIDAIMGADLIILSSGTQWSSLIPTYASVGFLSAINHTAAKVVMVMNRKPDKDCPGQTAGDIINAVSKYFLDKKVHVLLDSSSTFKSMTSATGIPANFEVFERNMGYLEGSTHHPNKLAMGVMDVYFHEYLYSTHFMFDFDDTLVGRGGAHPVASKTCADLLIDLLSRSTFMSICTGNSVKALTAIRAERRPFFMPPMVVFADGGVNAYRITVESLRDEEAAAVRLIGTVNPDARIQTEMLDALVSVLQANGISYTKIQNRGDVVVSMKPIDPEYRPAILSLVRHLLKSNDVLSGLTAEATGRSTIDIMKKGITKLAAVEYVLKGSPSITYVGDELMSGNDSPIFDAAQDDPRIHPLLVRSVDDTALFLITLANMAKPGTVPPDYWGIEL